MKGASRVGSLNAGAKMSREVTLAIFCDLKIFKDLMTKLDQILV